MHVVNALGNDNWPSLARRCMGERRGVAGVVLGRGESVVFHLDYRAIQWLQWAFISVLTSKLGCDYDGGVVGSRTKFLQGSFGNSSLG